MRPVQLDLEGFASFRRPTLVDFTDCDFFVLVGPTGAGKSTIVDAITFALYGTAPRWDRSNAVADALAPTTNRATVRLVFDVGAHRYVIAREVRRVGAAVQQKMVSLERYLDPTATGNRDADEATHSVAGDIKTLAVEVDKLLGLSYQDFIQCVALPQGQFAAFLKAKSSERQKILFKLLGAAQYDQIRDAASERARTAQEQVLALTARLEGLSHAGPQQVAAARTRHDRLRTLQQQVTRQVDQLQRRRQVLTESQSARAGCEAERDLLATVTVPADLTDRQHALVVANASLTQARDSEDAAARHHGQCRARLDAAGNRAHLAQLRTAWDELATVTAELPVLEAARGQADRALTAAETAAQAAERDLDRARQAQQQAEQASVAAQADVTALQATLDALTFPVKEEVFALGPRYTAALDAARQATRAVSAAAGEVTTARTAAEQHRPPQVLQTALTVAQAGERARARLSSTVAAAETAAADLQAAATAQAAAVHAEHQAQAAQADLAARHAALGLRDHLRVGDPCPVCEKAVSRIPDSPDGDFDAARDAVESALARARAEVDASRHRLGAAEVACAAAVTAVQAAQTAIQENSQQVRALVGLDTAGADEPDPTTEWVESALQQSLAAHAALDSHLTAHRSAVDVDTAAQAALAALNAEVTAARTVLADQWYSLVPLGVPAMDDEDLTACWQRLTGWAGERAGVLREEELPAARQRVTDADTVHRQAVTAAQTAVEDHRRCQAEQRNALDRAAQARAEVGAVLARRAILDGQTREGPTAAEVHEALQRLTVAEQAEREAFTQMATLRRITEDRRADLSEAEQGLAGLRSTLGRTRDALVHLGAPEPGGADVGADWRRLADWAAAEARGREDELPRLIGIEVAAQQAHDAELAALAAAFEAAEISAPDPSAAVALVTLGGAVRDAAGALRDAERDLAIVQRLEADWQATDERRQVAGMLAELLKANKFQRWLAGAALQVLVEGASRSLAELSGGQFDLTHRDGEFYVIDHTDAESQRSVRTLSGGETFQTSLALALALAEQLSGMGGSGGARLESIFLDEGFGTLDADSLDVVAATLERLAQGDRMVGIVTHVRELADRVPVRLHVRRDSAGSHLTREQQ